jgi:Ni/Co efflux regulator RcnB
MKRVLLAAAALSLLGGSAALADPGHGHGRGHDNGLHRGWHKGTAYGPPGQRHHWARGERLPREYMGGGYYVDYRAYHLRAPPPGYRWVRVDDRYILVALATGLIASIILANS